MCIKIKNTYFSSALCFILALNLAVSRLCYAENSSHGRISYKGRIDLSTTAFSQLYFFLSERIFVHLLSKVYQIQTGID